MEKMNILTEQASLILYEDFDEVESELAHDIEAKGFYSEKATEAIENIVMNEIKKRIPYIEFTEDELKEVALAKHFTDKINEANGEVPYNLLRIKDYGFNGGLLDRCLESIANEKMDELVDSVMEKIAVELPGSVKHIIKEELKEDFDKLIPVYNEEKIVQPNDKRDQKEIESDIRLADRALSNIEKLKSTDTLADFIEGKCIESSLSELEDGEYVNSELTEEIKNSCMMNSSEQEITNDDIINFFENSSFKYDVSSDEFCEFFAASSKRI